MLIETINYVFVFQEEVHWGKHANVWQFNIKTVAANTLWLDQQLFGFRFIFIFMIYIVKKG